jgi:hypothetical protein
MKNDRKIHQRECMSLSILQGIEPLTSFSRGALHILGSIEFVPKSSGATFWWVNVTDGAQP